MKYPKRLKHLGLTDLEIVLLRFNRPTRGNSLKLERENFPSAIKNNFGSAVTSRHNFFQTEWSLSGMNYQIK